MGHKKFDISTNEWVKQAFENRKYAFAADYIRIYALYTEGGIYLDTDVEVLGNFNRFLNLDFFTGFENGTDIEAAIIGSIPGHPFLKEILNYYDGRKFKKEDGSFDMKILPVIMALILKSNFGFVPNDQYQALSYNIHVFPHDYFSPKDVRTHKVKLTKNTITIHHFNAGWIKRNLFFYIKRYIHIIALLFGSKFYNSLVNVVRKFTGNSNIEAYNCCIVHPNN